MTGEGAGSLARLAFARVLFVEDDPIIGWDTADILRTAGADVVGPIGRVDRALQVAQSEVFNAALLDVRLTDGLVLPVAMALKQKRVPFAFYTGESMLHPDLADAVPHYKVLSKPASAALIVQTIAGLLL